MQQDLTTNLILLYLNNQKNNVLSNINIVRHDRAHIKYVSLYFCYRGIDVEIQIYNPTFIKVLTKETNEFCDSVTTVRAAIDTLYARS